MTLIPSRRRSHDDGASSAGRGALRFLRDVVVIFLAALVVSFLVKTFLIRSFYIPSGSMEQTLQIDDRIIVNELVPDLVDVKRGDVVVFEDPGGWLQGTPQVEAQSRGPLLDGVSWFLTQVGLGAQDSDEHLVKRVIGLPGDTVACCDDFGQVTVNGVPIDEDAYISLPVGETRASGVDFSVTVPEGSLWVMGDNRYNSQDSRYNTSTPSRGFVPIDDVVGRAFVVSWPFDRWGWLSDHPEVFRGTDRQGQGG